MTRLPHSSRGEARTQPPQASVTTNDTPNGKLPRKWDSAVIGRLGDSEEDASLKHLAPNSTHRRGGGGRARLRVLGFEGYQTDEVQAPLVWEPGQECGVEGQTPPRMGIQGTTATRGAAQSQSRKHQPLCPASHGWHLGCKRAPCPGQEPQELSRPLLEPPSWGSTVTARSRLPPTGWQTFSPCAAGLCPQIHTPDLRTRCIWRQGL